MARDSRRGPTRNGPGRDTPRARTVSRPRTRSASAKAGATAPQRRTAVPSPKSAPATPAPSLRRAGLGITRRAVAMIVVVAILVLSYATSLRVWLDQQSDIASTKADIAQRQERIAELEKELARWDDPEYVKAQARARLGWAVPGETGYRVVGPDGEPLGGTGTLNETEAAPPQEAAWWGKLAGSVHTVDQPEPAAEAAEEAEREPTAPETIGPEPDNEPTP
ncbi:FtsB family cell division protein [Enemella sp. A6]|uniref:FtsB family cell division protein n=1 Tax=Enemella sp. A6 TaxID=3440152 RepID=UPI003EBA3EAA